MRIKYNNTRRKVLKTRMQGLMTYHNTTPGQPPSRSRQRSLPVARKLPCCPLCFTDHSLCSPKISAERESSGLPVSGLCINGSRQYILFCIWLLCSALCSLRVVQVGACSAGLFSLLFIFSCTALPQCIHCWTSLLVRTSLTKRASPNVLSSIS